MGADDGRKLLMSDSNRLEKTVTAEGLLWGSEVANEYHGIASSHMDDQWRDYINPFFEKYEFDLTKTIDFAAGFGRNTKKLLEAGAGHVMMVDFNQECIDQLKSTLEGPRAKSFKNDGYSLSGLSDQSASFFYSFDAMVHFDMEVIISYIPEIARVLKSGGHALLHHSNYSKNPGGDFRANPHWRNFMTAAILKHVAIRSRFDVIEQREVPWGEEQIDCISILRKK
ncbi:hypothetical protein DK389_16405 [Methylobacterium durans]|uniref:Methyltransferase domain-containing protein n=2 Tax=Methylobacterium durans TaxID=2202825 RepID=A0A2U8W6T2_9HYPH|nr:hypothetical protein DK389_16405 [Methylobacterium durans]